MSVQNRTFVIIGAGILIGLFLLCAFLALFALFSFVPFSSSTSTLFRRYDSNGQRIFLTGTSDSGDAITADMSGMHGMYQGQLTCADCHGADGKGGTVRMMMFGSIQAPDIRYQTLTSPTHGENDEEQHLPYTDQTLRRAITQGIDPSGESLEWPMPHWSMSERDLNDLIDYLKTLK